MRVDVDRTPLSQRAAMRQLYRLLLTPTNKKARAVDGLATDDDAGQTATTKAATGRDDTRNRSGHNA
jgi:hypothetical protein